ncbi:MAG: hypothetical protein KDB80_01165 [Planctomycetes bacterium]|nr:hypothetical protein [Planctomycetota bacterium]
MTILPRVELPPPPRTPSWRAALAERQALGWFGAALVLAGALVVYVIPVSPAIRDLALGAVMLPGMGFVMIWLRYVMRFRVLLTHGEVARAQVDAAGGYTFVDRSGRERTGRVSRPTPAGFAAVVYDAARPSHHRIVDPSHFTHR